MNTEARVVEESTITVNQFFEPGDIGQIISLHGLYYGRQWGLNDLFEAQIAQGLGDFAIVLMDEKNRGKNRQWVAKKGDTVIGAIAIQQDAPDTSARLRRFIVAEEARGTGLGNRLMDEAMTFCHQAGYKSVVLWTYLGLDSARHLYEKHGFVLTEQKPKDDWGKPLTYVKFKCPLVTEKVSVIKATLDKKDLVAAIVDEYSDSADVRHRDSAQDFLKYFDSDAGAWLACVDNEIAGCILLRPIKNMLDCCEVKRLYVKPQYRGFYAADKMLHALHDEAKRQGYKWCYLDTKDDLQAAIHFYKRHGYVDCDRYNDNSQATVFMRRPLQ